MTKIQKIAIGFVIYRFLVIITILILTVFAILDKVPSLTGFLISCGLVVSLIVYWFIMGAVVIFTATKNMYNNGIIKPTKTQIDTEIDSLMKTSKEF